MSELLRSLIVLALASSAGVVIGTAVVALSGTDSYVVAATLGSGGALLGTVAWGRLDESEVAMTRPLSHSSDTAGLEAAWAEATAATRERDEARDEIERLLGAVRAVDRELDWIEGGGVSATATAGLVAARRDHRYRTKRPVAMILTDCRVYWGSHGCRRPRGHDGPHECQCARDAHGHLLPRHDHEGTLNAGAEPFYGADTRFYGEDAKTQGRHDD
jgi:hypothetical protein